jgi:hypothetical protein
MGVGGLAFVRKFVRRRSGEKCTRIQTFFSIQIISIDILWESWLAWSQNCVAPCPRDP